MFYVTVAIGIILVTFLPEAESQRAVPTDEKGQIDRNATSVQELLTTNNLTEKESFRCGVFFAGKELKDKPFEKIYILPKRFPINASYYQEDDSSLPKQYASDASCPIKNAYGTVEEPSVHNNTCWNIFYDVVNKLRLEHDSFARNKGKSIGDDMCNTLIKLGIQRLPPNIRFKDGIPIGFYYNTCTDKTWYDTGLRLPQQLCCDPKTGKSNPRYKACIDF